MSKRPLMVTISIDGEPIRMEVINLEGVHQITANTLASQISVNAQWPTLVTVTIKELSE